MIKSFLNTKYSDSLMLGWEQENNLKALLKGVQFCLFVINVDKFQVYILQNWEFLTKS